MRASLANKESNNFNLDAKLVDTRINNIASTYCAEHFNELRCYIMSLNIIDKADDLFQDVILSILKAENNGESFDDQYNGGSITVEQFVYSRIKAYAKNTKYSSKFVESFKTSVKGTREAMSVDGRTIKSKTSTVVDTAVYAASFNGDANSDSERASDSFQVAYMNAASSSIAGELEAIESLSSLRSNIEKCIDICSLYNYNILNILKNIDVIAGHITHRSSEQCLNELTSILNYNSEAAESFKDILSVSSTQRDFFNSVIATY